MRTTGRGALVALLAVGAILGAACDDDRRAISRDDLPEVPEEPTLTVQLSDDGFHPDTLSVTTLDLIEFTIDGERHGIRTEDHSIDTGPLYDGETTLLMLTEPGDVTLYDTENPDESIAVVVVDVEG